MGIGQWNTNGAGVSAGSSGVNEMTVGQQFFSVVVAVLVVEACWFGSVGTSELSPGV